MLTKERRSAIAVLVSERGAVDVKELTTRFGVTNETVRKEAASDLYRMLEG